MLLRIPLDPIGSGEKVRPKPVPNKASVAGQIALKLRDRAPMRSGHWRFMLRVDIPR